VLIDSIISTPIRSLNSESRAFYRSGSPLQPKKSKDGSQANGAAIRRPVEIPREMRDGSDVTVDGVLSVVATREFFDHHLAKVGYRELLSL
jgi:hypothetical protein